MAKLDDRCSLIRQEYKNPAYTAILQFALWMIHKQNSIGS